MDALYQLSYRGIQITNMVLEVGLDWSKATTTSCFFQQPVKVGAGSRTRTYEARRREIYSLLSLPLDDSSTNIIITKIPKKATS